jgi:N-acetylmuramate 1-kinase
MSVELLLDQTWVRFPAWSPSKVTIHPIEKGGSDRRYYRLRPGTDDSLILVKYNHQKTENTRFVEIASFLAGIGVNVPRIYFHDPEQGLIWMQDLGENDLWKYRNVSWKIRQGYYQATLDQVLTLHQADLSSGDGLELQPGFDESLYSWEQNYFFENCLRLVFKIPENELGNLSTNSRFRDLSTRLASYPRVLVHRDFQSQNIIIHKRNAFLIDFQGLRAGLAQYDLASLLMDPYASLSVPERNSLLHYYFHRNGQNLSFAEFEQRFLECAIQRLMQALGAYGTIALIRGKPEFLRHIGPAIKNLIEVASSLKDFKFFVDFLDRLPKIPHSPNLITGAS